MLKFIKPHGLEGVVAKRSDSVYQPGLRSGLWTKHRINLGQEFVVGGYTPGTHGFDALIVGFYRGQGTHLRRARSCESCAGDTAGGVRED